MRYPIIVAAAVCCAHEVSAGWVGGAFVTRDDWSQAATTALGQQATVFRLFHAFDRTGDAMINSWDFTLRASSGTLYQDPLGSDQPPAQSLTDFVSTVAWDTFVTGGNLRSPSWVLFNPNFAFTATGLEDSNGWGTPGGGTAREGRSRAPGGVDFNGDQVIPSDFDPAYSYTFWMQITVLGVSVPEATPIWDGGFIHSDFFTGSTSITWQAVETAGSGIFQPRDIPIHNPAPGGVTAALLTMGAVGLRRRR